MVQRLVHGCRNPLSDQAVEVDGATEELQNAQGKKSLESRDVEDDTAVTLRNGKKKHRQVCLLLSSAWSAIIS